MCLEVLYSAMDRKMLIDDYIACNMVGEQIRIMKVLYFDSKVWYIAEHMEDPMRLYMCYFGHTKPSAQTLERYLNNTLDSDQDVIEVITCIAPDDLPSTAVDIADAIDVLSSRYSITTMAQMEQSIDRKILTEFNRMNKDVNDSPNAFNCAFLNYLPLKADAIKSDVSRNKDIMYRIDTMQSDTNSDEWLLSALFRNNNMDFNVLENLYSNTVTEKCSDLSHFRYVYDPRLTYYNSREYFKDLLHWVDNHPYKEVSDDEQSTKLIAETDHNIFVMRHCLRLGQYDSSKLVPINSNNKLQTDKVCEDINDTMYDLFSNSVEQIDTGDYVSCSISSDDNSVKKSSMFSDPTSTDINKESINLIMNCDVVLSDDTINGALMKDHVSKISLYKSIYGSLSVDTSAKTIEDSIFFYKMVVAPDQDDQANDTKAAQQK